jgi:hypothetical protein
MAFCGIPQCRDASWQLYDSPGYENREQVNLRCCAAVAVSALFDPVIQSMVG